MRRKIALGFVALALILLGYWFWHLYRLPFFELEKEWQAIKAAGEPMRYEDLMPPIEPSLNAATVYQKAISALPTLSWTEERMLDELWSNRPVDKKKVRRILRRCQSALAISKRASHYLNSRWIKWQPNPYSTKLRHLSPLRLITRLLRTETAFYLQEGDVDKALDNCVVLLRIMHHLWEEPCAGHARYALIPLREAGDIVQRVCDSEKGISSKRFQKLMNLISQWDGDRALVRLLQLQRVIHLQLFNHLRATPKEARVFSLMWGEGSQIFTGGNLAGWVQPVSRQLAINELILLRFERRLLEIARKGEPYDWNEFRPLDEMVIRVKTFGFTFERPQFLRGFSFRPFAIAGELLMFSGFKSERQLPELAWAFEIIAKTKAYQRLLQTALALSEYHLERGSYPVKLSDLVPNHLPNVPKDPFDSKPLRYRREGQGFKLWSVGDDLKDDGGINANDITFSVGSKAILSTKAVTRL